jgi:NAD(P)-dependent dehydrogenase (short-subunit alcohol dehydrogenase family)
MRGASRDAVIVTDTDVGGIMSTATTSSPTQREPELLGQTVVVIGGSAGIGLETARRARAEGANVILTGSRHPGVGLGIASTITAALPALTANLALELAPVRVNLIAAGFVDTPLSASLLGDELENRRNQLRATLPIRRVVGPADVAALAVHIMINTALTGATYDVDGGQQLFAGS